MSRRASYLEIALGKRRRRRNLSRGYYSLVLGHRPPRPAQQDLNNVPYNIPMPINFQNDQPAEPKPPPPRRKFSGKNVDE